MALLLLLVVVEILVLVLLELSIAAAVTVTGVDDTEAGKATARSGKDECDRGRYASEPPDLSRSVDDGIDDGRRLVLRSA